MDKMTIEAKVENLDQVLSFIGKELVSCGCSPKARMQMDIAVEEIFVNIASYAYTSDSGTATITIETTEDPLCVTVIFSDEGIPYDPLAKPDPDVTLSSEERRIGGLGVFMAKKSVSDIHYKYQDGRNILTIRKEL